MVDPDDLAFYALDHDADGEVLTPTRMARSLWSDNQMHGVAVSAALARTAERAAEEAGRADLVPSRYAVDLFKPPRMEPSRVRSTIVRAGSRICLVDVVLEQADGPVARAGVTFLRPSEPAPGEAWTLPGDRRPTPPPEDVAPPSDTPRVPFFRSATDWSQDFTAHQDAGRKMSWNTAVNVVIGAAVTPFQAAAATADGASMVSNWGTAGVQYINTDITLVLARRPIGREIGLAALDRLDVDGIAAGTVAMFDRAGPLGTVQTTALANSRRTIDFRTTAYRDDGERTTVPPV